MNPTRFTIHLLGLLALTSACNGARQQECDRFLSAMKPLDEGLPSAEVVDSVQRQVDTIQLTDQPLREYAKNYKATLTVLSNTTKLRSSPSAPDGTDDVIKAKLKEARTDRDDVKRYCSQ